MSAIMELTSVSNSFDDNISILALLPESLDDKTVTVLLKAVVNQRAMASFSDIVWLVTVAALWGFTNPFIKQGGKGIEQVKRNNKLLQLLNEIKFLLLNWKYMVPFLINQSGSVLYYITLASADLSLAVPITNSLTFIFTTIAGRLTGEKIPGTRTYAGVLLVAAGVALCALSKSY